MKLPFHFSILLLLFVLKFDLICAQFVVLVDGKAPTVGGTKSSPQGKGSPQGACSATDAIKLEAMLQTSMSVGQKLFDVMKELHSESDAPIFETWLHEATDADLEEIRQLIQKGLVNVPKVITQVTEASPPAGTRVFFRCSAEHKEPSFDISHEAGGPFEFMLYSNFFKANPHLEVLHEVSSFKSGSSPKSTALLFIGPLISVVGLPIDASPVIPAKLLELPFPERKKKTGFFVMLAAEAYIGDLRLFTSNNPLPKPASPGFKTKLKGAFSKGSKPPQPASPPPTPKKGFKTKLKGAFSKGSKSPQPAADTTSVSSSPSTGFRTKLRGVWNKRPKPATSRRVKAVLSKVPKFITRKKPPPPAFEYLTDSPDTRGAKYKSPEPRPHSPSLPVPNPLHYPWHTLDSVPEEEEGEEEGPPLPPKEDSHIPPQSRLGRRTVSGNEFVKRRETHIG